MYELLLRTETLWEGLSSLVLLGVGVGALVAGCVLWLGGSRHSTVIIGLLGALVGAALGLLVSPWLNLNLWLCMIVAAAVLAGISVLLRNILVLALAVLVLAALGGGGYLAVVLDRAAPQMRAETGAPGAMEPAQEGSPRRTPGVLGEVPNAKGGVREPRAQPNPSGPGVQSFSDMDRTGRMDYMKDISGPEPTFRQRAEALLANTWEAIRPHGWMVALAAVAGAVVGLLLVWFVAKIVIALAYSIVGTTAIFLGAQAALLAAGYAAVSALTDHRRVLPITFLVMIAIGWLWQLLHAGRRRTVHHEVEQEPQQAK